ncbi:MAG: sulfotransferase [Zetaproteobacteria bacterium]|nr:sulfotransferase [Zetaproteobacteria bacterium]
MSFVESECLKNRYPDFFLVGAMKTGTTSIYNVLKKHPCVFCSPIKEPNYYCTDISELVKEKGGQWNITPIQSQYDLLNAIRRGSICEHIVNKDVYLSLFENARNDQFAGEFSVAYMRSASSASEISKDCPNARIIMVLRNPIDRAFSDFSMALMLGLESCDFSEMVTENLSLPEPSRYLSDGLYYEQVKRYLDVFPREQVLILLQEELRQDFSKSIAKVLQHIGAVPVDGDVQNPKSFEGKAARFPVINRLMYKSGLKRIISAALPKSLVFYGKSLFYKKKPQNDCISESDRILLSSFYKKDLNQLCDLIDRDLSYWLS